MKENYTREKLLSICERAFVLEDKWSDRDSAEAQKQLGWCYAWLKDGCEFKILHNKKGLCTDEDTIWVEIRADGFQKFDWDGEQDIESFYLPTEKRLKSGSDWY